MQNAVVPILGFAAKSGTGKTTLLTALIPLLAQQNVRVGLIKHSHHNFEIDKQGKDSYRLRKAGASPVMLVSSHRRAVITEFKQPIEPRLDEQLKGFNQARLDLILVEGFKREAFPKIELSRACLNQPFLYPNDPEIIAVASDVLLKLPQKLHTLDINQPQGIADFIVERFLK
ncbi:MAG: molybdopterin-guanine dinucleotide biosynthesis protein B [Methylococcales bacterium]|nr:molybdopterin-guanine dinucleotide biosynthesis protein B [Methylococcales bacterium]